MQLTDPASVLDRTVVDPEGATVGTVAEVYLDTGADHAGWIAVRTGLFGQHVAPVPLADARWEGTDVVVAYPKAAIAKAPHHDPEMALSPEEEAALFEHYGLPYGEPTEARHSEPSAEERSTLHEGAGQASRGRLVRRLREAAERPTHAESAVTDVEPASYPDDALAAELERQQADREEELRRRQSRGL